MDDQIKQHQRLARNGGDPQESGNFGTEALTSYAGKAQPKPARGTLKDSQRGISTPKGYHPSPDHGSTD